MSTRRTFASEFWNGLTPPQRMSLLMHRTEHSELFAAMEELVIQIRPLFADRPAVVVSVVLADLLATLLATCPPEQREPILEQHVGLVHDLLPVAVAQFDAWEETHQRNEGGRQ
jgi:hypothetical protein